MRVNVYAEEMTDRVEIIAKEIDGHRFTGLRFYLELPVTVNGENVSGPFMHRPGDDDSAAVTFWGKQDLRTVLRHSLALLNEHYESASGEVGTRAETERLEIVEQYIRSIFARPDCGLSDWERTLVAGNLRSFFSEICKLGLS